MIHTAHVGELLWLQPRNELLQLWVKEGRRVMGSTSFYSPGDTETDHKSCAITRDHSFVKSSYMPAGVKFLARLLGLLLFLFKMLFGSLNSESSKGNIVDDGCKSHLSSWSSENYSLLTLINFTIILLSINWKYALGQPWMCSRMVHRSVRVYFTHRRCHGALI